MKTKSMVRGNPYSLLMRFALPLIAGNLFQEFYNITDTIIVGQFLGVNALAAVGAGGWSIWMILSALQALSQGFSVPSAHCFGSGDMESVKKNMGNAALLSLISCLFLCVLGEIILKPLLIWQNTPREIFDDALLYLRLYYAGCPIIMVYNYASSHLRAFGNSSAPLRAMIIASIVNIVLDILFVGPFGWGIKGAIFATLIAQGVAAIYSMNALRKIDFVSFSKENLRLQKNLCAKQLYLGAPMALQNIIISLGGIIVQLVVNRYGISFIAGVTATNRLYGLIETASISYGYAVTTYVGQNVGAGEYKRVKKGVVSGNIIGFFTSVFIMLIMIFFGKNLLMLFVSGTKEEIALTIKVAYRYLLIMSAFLPVLYFLNIVKSAIVGLGNSTIPMLSGVAELIMRVGCSFLLPIYFGEMNLFFAEPVAWSASVVVLGAGYFFCMRKLKKSLAE